MAAFVPIRLTAGGYHAKHHWSCILAFNIMFFAFCILIRFMNPEILRFYCLVSVTMSALIIWKLSPVEAVNKPLREAKRIMLRNKSLVITTVNMIIVLVVFFINLIPADLFAFYFSGMFGAGISLVAAVAGKNDKRISNDS